MAHSSSTVEVPIRPYLKIGTGLLRSQPATRVWWYFGPSDPFQLRYSPNQIFHILSVSRTGLRTKVGTRNRKYTIRTTLKTYARARAVRIVRLTVLPCCISLPMRSTLIILEPYTPPAPNVPDPLMQFAVLSWPHILTLVMVTCLRRAATFEPTRCVTQRVFSTPR